MSVQYLTKKIVESKHTDQPRWGMCADGYTKKSGAPTRLLIKLEGEKRFRRLMILQFSNNGSLFVKVNGERLFVNEYDIPESTRNENH